MTPSQLHPFDACTLQEKVMAWAQVVLPVLLGLVVLLVVTGGLK